jgi:general secretion pathway protein M
MSATAPNDPGYTDPADARGGLAGLAARLRHAGRGLAARWASFAPRERRLMAIAAAVLGAFLLWALAIAPAWRTLQSAPAQIDLLDLQLQQMQGLAAESVTLRAVPAVPAEQAQAALTAATERLGPPGKLSIQGDRVLLTLKGARPRPGSAPVPASSTPP